MIMGILFVSLSVCLSVSHIPCVVSKWLNISSDFSLPARPIILLFS